MYSKCNHLFGVCSLGKEGERENNLSSSTFPGNQEYACALVKFQMHSFLIPHHAKRSGYAEIID